MESLYEFKGERSAKIIKAATLDNFFKRPHLYIFVASFLTVAFYITFLRVNYNFDDMMKLAASFSAAAASFLIFNVILFLSLFFGLRRSIRLTVQRDRESAQGQNPVCYTVFSEDGIDLTVDRAGKISETHFDYNQLKRITKNKECVFIYTKAYQFMAVENSTIVKGDIDTFYTFLKEKLKSNKK